MPDAVDVAIETEEGGFFQFLNVRKADLYGALDRALADGVVLSIVSIESCALVIPWALVRRVTYIPSMEEDREEAWTTLWEQLSETG